MPSLTAYLYGYPILEKREKRRERDNSKREEGKKRRGEEMRNGNEKKKYRHEFMEIGRNDRRSLVCDTRLHRDDFNIRE